MKNLLMILVSILLTACAQDGGSSKSGNQPLPVDPFVKPRVLMIGDTFIQSIVGRIEVDQPEYFSSTAYQGGMLKAQDAANLIDQTLNTLPVYDLVFINVGFNDITLGNATPTNEFLHWLTLLVQRIKARGYTPVYVTTRFIPFSRLDTGLDIDVVDANVVAQNEAAKDLMSDLGVHVVDVYPETKRIHDEGSYQGHRPMYIETVASEFMNQLETN